MTGVVAILVLLGGLAIGATSIGGVVVVPVLTQLGQVAPQQAVAAASFAFAFSGAAAFLSRPLASAGPTSAFSWTLVAGAGAGAALGAATLAWLPARAVVVLVALLAVASGLHALFGKEGVRPWPLPVGGVPLLGLLVGALSAWSGTGGPVVLLPLLALLGWPAPQAVEAAQRVQLPVAAAATLVNLGAGRLDLGLGLTVGLLVLLGWAMGRQLACRLPVQRLRQGVAVALIATGLAFLVGH